MRVFTTTPMEDPRGARVVFPRLEEIGYDGAFSFEAKHDPVSGKLTLVVPAGAQEGLPIGVHIAANPFADEVALAAGAAVETSLGGYAILSAPLLARAGSGSELATGSALCSESALANHPPDQGAVRRTGRPRLDKEDRLA